MLIFRSVVAGKGILTSAFATGVLGFATAILFLFCTPDLDTLFSLGAPQPFVQIYALALGRGPSIFMTIIAVIGLIMVKHIALSSKIQGLSHRCSSSEHEYRHSRRLPPDLRRGA